MEQSADMKTGDGRRSQLLFPAHFGHKQKRIGVRLHIQQCNNDTTLAVFLQVPLARIAMGMRFVLTGRTSLYHLKDNLHKGHLKTMFT